MSSNAAKFIAEGEAYRKEALRKRFYERYKADKSRFRDCGKDLRFAFFQAGTMSADLL